jgi:tetratricopeptide (TPR) repeat protein
MNVPDTASIQLAAGARVRVNFCAGNATTINGTGAAVSLAGLNRCSGGASLSMASSFGNSTSRVAAVAGVRASTAAEEENPLTALNNSTEALPDEPETVGAALNDWNADNKEAAVNSLREYVAAHPNAWAAGYYLGSFLVQTGDFAGAVAALGPVCEGPRKGFSMEDARWNYMLALQATGDFEGSSRVAMETINAYPADPNKPRWHMVIAVNAAQQGNAELARQQADMAVRVAMERTVEALEQLQRLEGHSSADGLSTLFAGTSVNVDNAESKEGRLMTSAQALLDEHQRILDARLNVLSLIAE